MYTHSAHHTLISNSWVSIESSFDRIIASFLTTHAKVCPVAILVWSFMSASQWLCTIVKGNTTHLELAQNSIQHLLHLIDHPRVLHIWQNISSQWSMCMLSHLCWHWVWYFHQHSQKIECQHHAKKAVEDRYAPVELLDHLLPLLWLFWTRVTEHLPSQCSFTDHLCEIAAELPPCFLVLLEPLYG